MDPEVFVPSRRLETDGEVSLCGLRVPDQEVSVLALLLHDTVTLASAGTTHRHVTCHRKSWYIITPSCHMSVEVTGQDYTIISRVAGRNGTRLPHHVLCQRQSQDKIIHIFYLTQQKIGFNTVNVCTCCY